MNTLPLLFAILSAVLFGASTPLAKLLLGEIHPIALAGLLYTGVFLGLGAYTLVTRGLTGARRAIPHSKDAALVKKDLPWLAGAILAGGISAPVCLMSGLSRISGFAASLLLNFEGIATALIAVWFFKENAGKRVWLALAFMTAAGVFLAWSPEQGRPDLTGPILVLLAMIGWGLDNNLTRQISDKDPFQIATIKGLVSGTVLLSIAFLTGKGVGIGGAMVYGLVVGAVCYGLSLVLFIRALKGLGAFRTGAFFSLGPFVGSLASLVLLKDALRWPMVSAGLLMIVAVALILGEKHIHTHSHEQNVHSHSHSHGDPPHFHPHQGKVHEPHTHEHIHEATDHVHGHWPDTQHRHRH